MGLDSVELVVSVEELFNIEIPDKEAEKINTVGDFVDSVYSKIKVMPNDNCLRQIVFHRLRNAFINIGNDRKDIKPDSQISDFLNMNNIRIDWKNLEEFSKLTLPELVMLDFEKNLDKEIKIWGVRIYQRTEPITDGTIKNLIDWTISINFNEVIDLDEISSKYEVERIVCGVISENMGIAINEIELHHSITSDLGID